MKEIRFHGRGGQGAVTAAEILAIAALKEGKYCQAFPAFGPEKRGAPVLAFTRISETPIMTRTQIRNPDYVVVLDPSLLTDPMVNVLEGLKDDSLIIANTSKTPQELGYKQKTITVNATKIALEILGAPITNTGMLGAFVAATRLLSLEVVKEVIRERFRGELGEKNIKVIEAVYNEVMR